MTRRNPQRGIALILVIFVVTLASILVVNLAYSTYLNSRVSAGAQRSIQAEYLLKSALSLAQVLIDNSNPNFNSHRDLWAHYYDGTEIPVSLLGITEPNLKVSLEIRPADVGLNFHKLVDNPARWIPIFKAFFESKGMSNDKLETDESGLFPKKWFDPEELAVSLLEYQDTDTTSYANKGFEGDLPNAKEAFPNTNMVSLSELSAVPGFTAVRIRNILPYVTVAGFGELNINFVTGIRSFDKEVLMSLDNGITEKMAQDIQNIALSDKPFESSTDARIEQIIPRNFTQDVSFTVRSKRFQVIAEVDYGTSRFFLRAQLSLNTSGSSLPKVESMELF